MSDNTSSLESRSTADGTASIKNRAPDNRPNDMSYALIKRIHDAVRAGYIEQQFTELDIEDWMAEHNIRKEDGAKYKDGYAANLLYNSLIKEKKTKNKNSKWLHRCKNENGIYEYWFAELFPGNFSPE